MIFGMQFIYIDPKEGAVLLLMHVIFCMKHGKAGKWAREGDIMMYGYAVL